MISLIKFWPAEPNLSPTAPSENSVWAMMRFRLIRRATFVVFISFFVISMVYMGINYNAAEIPGTIWMNNAINGLVDAFAQLLGSNLFIK